jgi:N-methylhydantoinase A/oxoprolinase/acetone carboxylase beta subunit
MFEIVIDTGGTFTDAVLMDEDRSIRTAKFLTDTAEPANSIMGCIGILADQLGVTEHDVLAKTSTLVVGTTLSTNCVLEKKGAKCCLLYTKGFRDIPELGEKVRNRDIYNLKTPPPSYLIPRYLRFGIEERTLYDGQILTPLNEADVREAVSKAKAQDVEVPVICFLHSYSNPEHEEKAAELIRDDYPDVVVSSHILRRWMQYYRLSTAELAAYVKPTTTRFVRSLDKRMKDSSFKGTSLFVSCAGGVTTPELCLDNPTLLIGSGPAAGPLLGKFLAELAGFHNVIVLDVGGTSSDLALLPDLAIATTTRRGSANSRARPRRSTLAASGPVAAVSLASTSGISSMLAPPAPVLIRAPRATARGASCQRSPTPTSYWGIFPRTTSSVAPCPSMSPSRRRP